MKVLSIGRDTACDIVLIDDKDMISRRHAMLYITPMGKMTLVDQGQNGTYVNGIKINPNIPYPVSRKDIVSFARVKQLDWKLVPNPIALIRNMILGLLLITIATCGVITFLNRDGASKKDDASEQVPVAAIKDTVPEQKEEPVNGKQKPPQTLPSKEDCIKKKKEKQEKEMKEKKDSTQVSGETPKDSTEYIYAL